MGKHGGYKLRTGNGSTIARHTILALYTKASRTSYHFALHPVLVLRTGSPSGAGERVPALRWPDNVRQLLHAIFHQQCASLSNDQGTGSSAQPGRTKASPSYRYM